MMRQSRLLSLGTGAPEFSLPATSGQRYGLNDFAAAQALLVAFICNHCPYVKHMLDGLVKFATDYAAKSVAVVAINSNDVEQYPADSPAKMLKLAQHRGFVFPYLYDESQHTAKAYQATCTPDLFLFGRQRELLYRGQFDASRPSNRLAVTGADLRAATDSVLASQPIGPQTPSVGCSIKWKSGQEPEWA